MRLGDSDRAAGQLMRNQNKVEVPICWLKVSTFASLIFTLIVTIQKAREKSHRLTTGKHNYRGGTGQLKNASPDDRTYFLVFIQNLESLRSFRYCY